MKKMNTFMCILVTLGLTVLSSLVLAVTYFFTRIWGIAYVSCYIIMILILFKLFKSELTSDAKSLKDDIKNNWLNILIFTIIFTVLLYVSNYIIVKYLGSMAANEILSRNQIKSEPLLMGISTGILAPIAEEIIYRLPYKKVEKRRLLNFFIYTIIFALAHVAFNNGIKELLFLIPYMFLSLSIGYGFYKTNNIYVSMIVHILNNLANIMIILFL